MKLNEFMKVKFNSSVKKANTRGTGFLSLAKTKRTPFQLGDRVEVRLSNAIVFFAEIIEWDKWGIYVPKKIVLENDLLGKKVEVQIRKIKGFYSKLDKDGRIYIPEDIVRKHSLQENDVVLLKGLKGGEVVKEKYCRICLTRRPKRKQKKEYSCSFDKEFYGEKLELRIEKQDNEELKSQLSSATATIVEDMDYTFVDEDSLIIFEGNKVPATIPTKLDPTKLVFYLGAYFADGTKKGHVWAICASSFKQGRYYLKFHKLLIKDTDPEFVVSYTKLPGTSFNEAREKLTKGWENEVGIEIDRFRIRKPEGKRLLKRNEYGTLVIREARQILFDVYKSLLNLSIEKIITTQDEELAVDFVLGVLEGDGAIPARKRSHIQICTNEVQSSTLEKILEVTGINFKKYEEGKNKYSFKIGTREILRNFSCFGSKLFRLYPERRRRFFKRLQRASTVKFLIGDHKTSNSVKGWLKKHGFVDEDYELTPKGFNYLIP